MRAAPLTGGIRIGCPAKHHLIDKQGMGFGKEQVLPPLDHSPRCRHHSSRASSIQSARPSSSGAWAEMAAGETRLPSGASGADSLARTDGRSAAPGPSHTSNGAANPCFAPNEIPGSRRARIRRSGYFWTTVPSARLPKRFAGGIRPANSYTSRSTIGVRTSRPWAIPAMSILASTSPGR